MRKYYLNIAALAVCLWAISGCKKTKDTFTSRVYHGMVSKFNPLFNGEQALLKAEEALRAQHQDNFEEILRVYRWGDEQQASNVKPDLEKAIEKGSKVIQQHSMMIRNSQKNRFIDDSYMLIGKARFYQRDYLKALETFNYVLQEFPKEKVYYEARMWAARCKAAISNYLGAKEDFEEIYQEEDLPKRLKANIYASYAQLEIDHGSKTAAFHLLRQAIDKTRDKQQRVRWLFISGQLQSELGNDYEASEIFRKVIKAGPPYELLFHAKLNRARNYDIDLQDPRGAFDELEAMLRDDKNYDNRDQIYYVMAEVAEKLDDEALMEQYLKKSVEVSTTNQRQKALSYFKLAEVNFKNRMYPLAAAYYDSTYSNLKPEDPRYKGIQKKKESLDVLVQNLNTIETQDSLQALAELSEKQRNKVIDGLINKIKEEEEAQRRALEDPFAFNGNNQGGADQIASSGGQWYFYNQELRSVGIRDFTNRFGDRKLEDNWRRKNKQVIASDIATPSSDGEEQEIPEGENEGEDPRFDRETYLKDIPLTEKALAESHRMVIDAYLAVGRVYKDGLQDYAAAANALEELLQRYPDMEEKGRVWYTLFRIYTLDANQPRKAHYGDLILTNLPESEYAQLVRNEGSGVPLAEKNEVKQFYTQAYHKYKDSLYKESLPLTEQGLQKYGNTEYAPKFQLLKAFNEARLNNKEDFIKSLKLVVDRFSDSEEAGEAQRILEHIAEEEPQPQDTTAGGVEETKTDYTFSATSQHKYIVVVPNEGSKTNDLRIDITDFNKKFFKIDNLNTKSVFLTNDSQIILVSNFNNSVRAMDYYNTIDLQKVLEKYSVGNKLQHFVISSDNFQKFYKSKDVEEYLSYFGKNYLKSKDQ